MLPFSLIVFALVACGDLGTGHDCGEPDPWPKQSCSTAKVTLTCPPFWPPADAACPAQLYPLLSWALNDAIYVYLAEHLISPNFTFIDETIGIRSQGQEREYAFVDTLRCYYHGAKFHFSIATRTQEGACQKACGMVFMRLYHTSDEGLIIQDQTCMTACPDERNVWRFTEWRVLQSVPLAQEEKGFTQASWGEARTMKWDEWEENPCYQ